MAFLAHNTLHRCPHKVLRSPILPALYQPWITVAKELTQPGEVPQHVKDRLVLALGMLPSTLGKENQGFHDWSPRSTSDYIALVDFSSTELFFVNSAG